jgi:predicted naringenin-chalcone synthase
MPFLTQFHVIRPPFEYSQEDTMHWLARAHQLSDSFSTSENNSEEFHGTLLRKFLSIGTGNKKIEKRGSVVPDLRIVNFDEMEIYAITSENKEGKGIKERSSFFEKCADEIVEQFYENTSLSDHLIQVTCTGYVSPSAAQKIVAKKGALNTSVTHAYHMGCYASIPAVRIASAMSHANETVDIVHTEMCSLHMNPALHETEQLVVQTLFADGFIKYTVSNQRQKGFEILSTRESLIADSSQRMSWKQENWGMKMHIAKSVPILIRRQLKPFIQSLFEKAGVPYQDIYYAIHPGGPKIIDEIAAELNLTEAQVLHSTEILRNYGNMSSATLPHIWNAILNDDSIEDGALVLSLAFGPGLTLAGALMRKVN